jgi:hypothetical protein
MKNLISYENFGQDFSADMNETLTNISGVEKIETVSSKTGGESVPKSLVGRTVTIWKNPQQTSKAIDIQIVQVERFGNKAITFVGLDLSNPKTLAAYKAGKSVSAEQYIWERGTNKLLDLNNIDTTPGAGTYYNKWLIGELTKEYFK